MTESRLAFLQQLAADYQAHDQQVAQRADRYLNITPDTGPFLALLLQAVGARRILEIGTSTGYSTIWLADACQATGGHVTTVELNATRAALARANFAQVGLSECITQVPAPVADWLARTSLAPFDFVFLDADRSQYVELWPRLLPLVRPGGLVVVDNAVSHHEQLQSFTALVQATPGVTSVVVPTGKGEMLIWKASLATENN
ncbi:O-methyltransferase [Hymenobacter cheonanensis]|uniref:O-methyltransferase n=1 Tax=Hymenobacter sp. CA2-7 TaxID=3063993 RepID=UPI002713F39A|nr:O-methyltransferase [Hymenobacter sp. CA2-7]MDO7886038.1 O-methyltransferase [Hymenobacter sp. CA2-7]